MKLEQEIQSKMSLNLSSQEQEALANKLESVLWLRKKITPINTIKPSQKHKKMRMSNCTYVAVKCAKVLAGIEEPALAPARKKNLNITWREDEHGTIKCTEISSQEQAALLPLQDFVETIDLMNKDNSITIDLTQKNTSSTVKYITTSRHKIIDDIRNIAGCGVEGEDKTLVGLIYYFYENLYGGHLANFYRDKFGNVFFVDAQSNIISETPAIKVQRCLTRNELFFFNLPPRDGYFIKQEAPPIKPEPSFQDSNDQIMHIKKRAKTSTRDDSVNVLSSNEEETKKTEEKLFFLSNKQHNRIVDKKFQLDPEKKMYYIQSNKNDIRYDTAKLNKKVRDSYLYSMFVFESTENNRVYLKPVAKNRGGIKCYEKWEEILAKGGKTPATITDFSNLSESQIDEYANFSKTYLSY